MVSFLWHTTSRTSKINRINIKSKYLLFGHFKKKISQHLCLPSDSLGQRKKLFWTIIITDGLLPTLQKYTPKPATIFNSMESENVYSKIHCAMQDSAI